MNKKDVVIVGAGPSGIFTALEMLRCGSKKNIVIIEKGKSVEKRTCPKAKTQKCMNCKPYCNITTGFSGAGIALSQEAIDVRWIDQSGRILGEQRIERGAKG